MPATAVTAPTVHAPPGAPAAIELRGVVKEYRVAGGAVRALNGLDLKVQAGAIQGVVGFSGAGKTTLLRCLTALERPDAGQVLVSGVNLGALRGGELRRARARTGTIYQGFHLLHSRTALANVALPLELTGVSASERRRRALELLDWVGLADRANSYPAQLSGGQRQRVAIARALANEPRVLLADEPTSALDAETTASLLKLLRRVRDELDLTVLLITHELSAVTAICERVAVLDAGKVVEEGPTHAVFSAPSSAAGRRLLQVTA